MSIKKALMHYFDKSSNSMIGVHPETESSCVTDWHTGIMNSLASKTLGTVVSSLTTDSVFGKLMSLLLSASGVKYSLGTNGYVKFGSFFGGLIIQWITIIDDTSRTATFPVAFSTINYGITLIPLYAIAFIASLSNTNVSWKCFNPGNETEITKSISVRIIAVGY
jgi:hypothetical protein